MQHMHAFITPQLFEQSIGGLLMTGLRPCGCTAYLSPSIQDYFGSESTRVKFLPRPHCVSAKCEFASSYCKQEALKRTSRRGFVP